MEVAITKMSSKGQVVIPSDMRVGIKEGEKLIIIKNYNQIIIKRVSELDEDFRDDLEFARRTEEAWKEIEEGKYTSYKSSEEFLATFK